MKLDLNTVRPDHPSFAGVEASAKADAYEGDFSSKTFDAQKLIGLVFPDGNYTLPPELKASALAIGTLVLKREADNVLVVLPGLALKEGSPVAEHVASYLLALSVDTFRPYNLDRVLNPRKFGPPRDVESKFKNRFDTSAGLNEAGLAVARQFYGDNYDKSLGTLNPSDDMTFIKLMQKLLPTPRKGM